MRIARHGSAQTIVLIIGISLAALIVGLAILLHFAGRRQRAPVMAISPTAPALSVMPMPVQPAKPDAPITVPVPQEPEAPPEVPKPADHIALDLTLVFNDMIGAKWKRENHDDDGIPASGRVPVPGVLPRAFFHFANPDEPNAIQLQPGAPIRVSIPPYQRGSYGRLAIMHGSAKGNAAVRVTLHYSSGADVGDELRVQDWNRRDEAKETYVYKAMTAGAVQLFSQVIKLDKDRTLESVTFQSDAKPVIFSLTLTVSSSRPFDGNK